MIAEDAEPLMVIHGHTKRTVGIPDDIFTTLVLTIKGGSPINFYLTVAIPVFSAVEIPPRAGDVTGDFIVPVNFAEIGKSLISDLLAINFCCCGAAHREILGEVG
jgi:hypothetical protein